MREIRVDPYGIEIMLPKAVPYLIKLDSVSNITANILKQEMLSLGGDAAVARDALTGRTKKTNCLLIGNFSQFNRLSQKLNKQPFGLNKLAESLIRILNNYQREEFALNIGRYKLNVGKRAHIMGVVNLTPDSFSGDGLYKGQGKLTLANIVKRVKRLVKDGADIIDVGGESSRPGARPVSVKEELKRIVPVIKILSKNIPVPISVDTYKPEVARQALENGAVIVNDITGLKDLKMAKAVARYKAGVVIMHMRGNPRVMQKNLKYGSLIEEITDYLDKAIDRAQEAGIGKEKIVIDPGIGFGKSADHNLEILKRLREFKVLGRPILVGTSRKAFIRKILGMQGQTIGTVSSCVLAAESGANIVRVHDVKEVKQALVVLEKIRNVRYPH
ncbi:MAG: dihydropteroate synthase [Candidatus Omnitrophota bacterium]